MRLLHTSLYKLCEFTDNEVPPYAILSHTWAKNEVTYHDFLQGKRSEKIYQSCKLAASEFWSYIWIDTCCIDKSSSAELSEAINSMYRWYQSAEVCYAYIEDLPAGRTYDSFLKSRWFTRGWTLQELLAPSRVIFFDQNWNGIGSKRTLQEVISRATGISHDQLISPIKASVAAKMSWMSHRKTTRAEDMAYCLLGLFEVSMPLLYGEGERAFIRLQEEIMQHSDDQTIFAWAEQGLEFSGMLARHPSAFAESGDIVQTPEMPYAQTNPYRMTNIGLEIQFPVFDGYYESGEASADDGAADTIWWFEVPLGCTRLSDKTKRIFITLKQHGSQKASRINVTNINALNLPDQKVERTYRTFFVASDSSLLIGPNTQNIWGTPSIRLSAAAQEYFQYKLDASFGRFSPVHPQMLRTDLRSAPHTVYPQNGGKSLNGDKFELTAGNTMCSKPSDIREDRATLFISESTEPSGHGFLVYWLQIPKSLSPPEINVLRVAKLTEYLTSQHEYIVHFEPKPFTLHLDEADHLIGQMGQGSSKDLYVRLRHEIQDGQRSLVISIDVCEN